MLLKLICLGIRATLLDTASNKSAGTSPVESVSSKIISGFYTRFDAGILNIAEYPLDIHYAPLFFYEC